MQVIINIEDSHVENIVRSIMENFPEASVGNALQCISWNYDKWEFKFEDDNGQIYDLTKEKLLAAFPLIFTDKWPTACTVPPTTNKEEDWDVWLCKSDAIDFDAFVQLACLGEVIYG